MLNLVLTGVTLLLVTIYYFLRSRHRFWLDRGFPHVPDPHLLFGHTKGQLTSRHASEINQDIYRDLKRRGEPFAGFSIMILPAVMVADVELIKTVLVRDFNVFHDRGFYNDPKADPLSGHLFALDGAPWRILRQKLTPTFTSGRMKMMFDTILEVAEEFRQFMIDARGQQEEMEMKEVLQRFTSDVIGTCAFGLECNTLKNPDSDFLKYGNQVLQQKLTTFAKIVFALTFKDWAKALGVKVTDPDVEKFFMGITRETVEFREKNNVQRNDFMNLLLQLKHGVRLDQEDTTERSSVEGGITMNELAAQCFVFFIAGYETSSTTMNFCLYELAKNPEVQERLRNEMGIFIYYRTAVAANGGRLTYELVTGLQYLDNVVNETLRKYPPVDSLIRIPNRDYIIPGTNHVIPKDTLVQIPVYAIHHDPEIYPNPDRFDPDRFLPEAVESRNPYTYLPFGEGPRICIGLRFGLMQTKIGLITLLRNFRFSPSSKTPSRIAFEPKSFVLSPDGGNYLRFDKI